MFSTIEEMIQLMAYNQLLMSQLTNVQDQPLDLSLPKNSTENQLQRSTDAKAYRQSNCSDSIKNFTSPRSLDLNPERNFLSPKYSTLPHSPVSLGDSNPSDCSSDGDSSYLCDVGSPVRPGKPLLWHFLYHLLECSQYDEIIVWLDREAGHFQIKHPNLLATMWGQCKSNPNMTFECLSRSLRAYYQKGIISKKCRLQYQFSGQALASLNRSNVAAVTMNATTPME